MFQRTLCLNFFSFKNERSGMEDSLRHRELSKSRIQKWETERFIFVLLLRVQMRAPISQSDPSGKIFGRAFGKTHFHHWSFNVSVAICSHRLTYGAETELSGELTWPSNDSWKRTRASSDPRTGLAFPACSPPAHRRRWPPSLRRVRGTSVRRVKTQPVLHWP